MAELTLKEYQQESLDAIARFCQSVKKHVDAGSSQPVHEAYFEETGRQYHEIPQLSGVPYFCLRVPTGGGKTLVAAHAIGVIARHLGQSEYPLCLWVTPSTTIRDQTLRGLRNREHPLYAGLRESLGASIGVSILTLEEALSASRAMLSNSATIVVTTIQSYRIRNEKGEEDKSTRKVYEDNGYLMDHFANLSALASEQLADGTERTVTRSLANAMSLRGPIVIMDEAHNARTRVSFDSLSRFGPLAVLELTATPSQRHDPSNDEYASNVLHAVSALQLSREGMIKLPIELESRGDWIDVLATTVERRTALEKRAREWEAIGGRFIRPIALIQAQSRNKNRETHTVDAIKTALVEQLKVPSERVRIATGDQDELGNEDLGSKDCVVEYIVTVEKLREGWDCPFAYVLGSVGNVATATAVEQLLGRVLRMPNATPTGVVELDRAYAIVQSKDVAETARSLGDTMVKNCGFDANSVRDALRVHSDEKTQAKIFPIGAIPLSNPLAFGLLPTSLENKLKYNEEAESLHIVEELTREETIILRDSLPEQKSRDAVEDYFANSRAVGVSPKSIDNYAQPIRMPQLIVRDNDRNYLFEPQELDEFVWNLGGCDFRLKESEFSSEPGVGKKITLGISRQGGMLYGGVEAVRSRQLTLAFENRDWSKTEVAKWLDTELRKGGSFIGLTKSESQPWFLRVVDFLIAERGVDISVIVRKRNELANVLRDRLASHGRAQIRAATESLFGNLSPRIIETSWEFPVLLEEEKYAPYSRYKGNFTFKKHAFDAIGSLNGEEELCAKHIDDHQSVTRWLRNIESESAGGFSLPLSPRRFFPDFLVELLGNRVAIVEYKGRHLAENSEELHKKETGELWASRSNGSCVFGWIVDKNWRELDEFLRFRC
ncbi:MAG: DEAD/DEAH box helicase family protein [Planctomycetes bacterium]|nr:DEAD/DEAH box helicase family protein [Planctomycetota bacterium]